MPYTINNAGTATPPISLALAEDVALLSLLRNAPTTKQTNLRPDWASDEDPSRLLSFDGEVDLTSTLAMLCGISDSPFDVVATCVEELSDKEGIKVIVAINKKSATSGSEVLVRIKGGLEKIFHHLSRANHVKEVLLEDVVLGSIASMCKHRIFSRIRSKRPDAKYTKKNKLFLGKAFQQILEAVHSHGCHTASRLEVDAFDRDGRTLLRCLENLEACERGDIVGNIKHVLRAAHQLNKATNFGTLLEGLNSTELNPSLRSSFINRLGKLAWYPGCALYLVRIARISGLFKKTEVTLVSLAEKLFVRDLTPSATTTLTGCLNRCYGGASSLPALKNMTSKLQELDRGDSAFSSAVRKTLGDSRVHAEVQILCHYELNSVTRKPRVICSSKDACYLCNLLIKLQGSFYTPRTHGNLYNTWRLLPIPTLNQIRPRLNNDLELQIRGIVSSLMSANSPRLTMFWNENESTVFPFSAFPPTPASSVMLVGTSGGQAVEIEDIQETQRHPQEIGNVISHGPPLETPPQSPTTGTSNSIAPDPEHPSDKHPLRGSRPVSAPLPGPGSPKGPDEPAKEDTTKLPTASPDNPSLIDKENMQSLERHNMEQKRGSTQVSQPKREASRKRRLERILESEREPAPEEEAGSHLSDQRQGVISTEPAQFPSPTPGPNTQIRSSSPENQRANQHHHHVLTRRQTASLRLDSLSDVPPSFTAAKGLITICPDFIRSLSTTSLLPADEQVHVNIQWLSRRRAAAFYLARPRGFIDLDLCEEEVGEDIDGGSSERVYVAYRGEVVVVDVVRRGAESPVHSGMFARC